jgi:tRNA G26 N,N-dimethylase Trm1
MYTNISFTEKQREDELKIYDNLKSNGFFEQFYQAMEETEYNELFELLNTIKKTDMEYKTSVGAIVNKLIEDLPANAEAAAKIVNSFNPEQYKAVIDFANYANGNRNIKTNLPVE